MNQTFSICYTICQTASQPKNEGSRQIVHVHWFNGFI